MKKLFFLAVCALLLTAAMPVGALVHYYAPAIPDEYVDQMEIDGDLTDWFAWIDPAYVYTASEYGWFRWGIPPEDLEDFDVTWMWGWSPKTNLFYRGVYIHDDEHIAGLTSFEGEGSHKPTKDDCITCRWGYGRNTGFVLPDGTIDTANRCFNIAPGRDPGPFGEGRFNVLPILMRSDLLGEFTSGHYLDAWYYQEPYCYHNVNVVGSDCYYELALQCFDPWDVAGPDLSEPATLSEGYFRFSVHFHDADSGKNENGEDGMAVGNCFQTGMFLVDNAENPCLYLLAPEVSAVSSSSWGAIKALFK